MTAAPFGFDTPLYYRHSGKFPISSIVFTLATGLVGAAVLAAVYAYLILYIPLAGWVSFILTGGFGFLVGMVMAAALKWGRVRSMPIAATLCVIVSLFALYVAWGVWLYAIIQRDGYEVGLLEVLLAPMAMWETVVEINAYGAWTLNNFTPTGLVLWLIWAAEGAIVVGLTLFAGLKGIALPFCEECHCWCNRTDGVLTTSPGDPAQTRQHLEKHDMSYFEQLGPMSESATTWFQSDICACPQCAKMHTLSVSDCTLTVDKNGKASIKSKTVVRHLLVTPEHAAYARDLMVRFKAAEAQPEVAPSEEQVSSEPAGGTAG